jgi:hypothetical protein
MVTREFTALAEALAKSVYINELLTRQPTNTH